MKKYPEAGARDSSDASKIATAQSKIKLIVNDHVRDDRPAWELKAHCGPIVQHLKEDVKNEETRAAVDESMDRYIHELIERFRVFYRGLRDASGFLIQQKAVPYLKKDGFPSGGIPLSEDPLSYNMEPAAREYFEAYQKAVRGELEHILKCEPRKHDGNVNLRTIAELNVRYERQTKMMNDLVDRGEDLVWIEPHANCSQRCEPWQGKLYSLSGRSGKTEEGITYRPLSDATDVFVTTKKGTTYRNGCITGFGCRHKLVPYRPGRRPQMIPAEIVERQRVAEEKQRLLERRIRYEKEKAALLSGVDPKEAKRARLRARGLARYYEQFSAENNLAAVRTRLRTVPGEEIYKRNAPVNERAKYGI